MYLATILLWMLVLPAASVAVEALRAPGAADLMALIGKWFTFWAVGARLFTAGAMQTFRPQFTAGSIFDLKGPRRARHCARGRLRESGNGNACLLSLAKPEWVVPAAIVGGLYYGLAGLGHLLRKTRNFKEQTALVSDLAIFVLLAALVASRAV
jgi:hypothetical protein